MRDWLSTLSVIVVASFLLVGCGSSEEPTQSKDSGATQQPTSTSSAVKSESDTLPLLPIMINLEKNMTTIQAGMWRENYETIRKAADGIANHAKIPKSQLGTIKSILGPEEFKTFVADDKKVHRTSLELAEAAKQRDFEAVTERYVDLYDGCVSCHLSHRETIRESPKW